jgi:superoxide dismutase
VVIENGTLVETLDNELAIVISSYRHRDYIMYVVAMINEDKWPHTYYAFYEHEIRSLEDAK